MSREADRDAFPEVDEIERDSLRTGVIDAWAGAMDEAEIDPLESVPWLPPTQRDLDLDEEFLVPHVRDVCACAVAIADRLVARRGVEIDLDVVLAGALVHDVSKLAEFDGMEPTPVYDLLGHPYYGVHVVARAGLPIELAHVVLSHTSRTAVEPATMEAEIVRRADETAAAAVRTTALDDLRDA